jgi:hypothetical protein
MQAGMGELQATAHPGVPVATPRAGSGLRVPAAASRLLARADHEAFLVVIAALYLIALTWDVPSQLASDTWMTLAYGHQVVHNGLPHHDTLTIWAHGRTWVDQQWLGQILFYGAYALGGLRAAIALHVAAVGTAFVLALTAARRLGGSTRSVTWLAVLGMLPIAWSSWTLRVQSLVFPLFVALLWLLAADSRRPSRRVLLALPLVAVWANLHGTAFVAAGLVALRGGTILLERARPLRERLPLAAALLASPLLLLASPYALGLPGYYHRLLLNPGFGKYVTEWAPTKLAIGTAPFYVLALLAVWLAGRCRDRMTLFDQGALLLTLVLAFLAIRSVVWFMLAGLVLLPAALDGILASHWAKPRSRLVNRLMVLPAVGACAWLAASALAHPHGWYTRDFPAAASKAVARVTQRDPGLRVFANERYADWLVLEDPGVAGRLAFDGRFELLRTDQLKRIVEFRARTEGATSVLRGYGLYVLDPASERKVAKRLLQSPSRYVVYGDGHVIVIRQLPGRVTAA